MTYNVFGGTLHLTQLQILRRGLVDARTGKNREVQQYLLMAFDIPMLGCLIKYISKTQGLSGIFHAAKGASFRA